MIYLDDKTDSILPYGLKSTPFETVYKALQAVASTVWPVDAAELRAAVGWGWYLVNAPDKLAGASAGRVFIQNALISEGAPLVKATQTQAELVDLLARWRTYRPTFDALEGLYQPYAATVDVRPITDAATQAILPVTDIHGAFYVVVTDVDWSRPLTLDDAVLIAERATPMGSRPIALYGFEELTPVTATAANGDAWSFVDSVEIAQDPPTVGLEVLLGSQWNGSTWAGGKVQYENASIARLGVMNQTDADSIVAYGLTLTGEISAYHSGPFGFINYNSNYEFELIGAYSDVSGETPIDTDLSWFTVNTNNNWVNLGGAGWGPPYLVSGIKTVRLRIKAPSTPLMYDVWIESVDVANNVVIALRSVFTGLTASRANTIVNNAPTYLSRYNGYLNNQGGPFTQADAIAMRDRLQSYIPSGDSSTFGIRPVST